MSLNNLVLTFSETVDILTFNLKAVGLQAFKNSGGGVDDPIYFLSSSSWMKIPDASTEVSINLGTDDAIGVRRVLIKEARRENTYIAILSGVLKDMNHNDAESIGNSDAFMASKYIPDTIPPKAIAFDLNMNTGNFSVQFQEPVRVKSFRPEFVTIFGAQNGTGVDLTGGTVTTAKDFSEIIAVDITSNDLNVIKAETLVASKGRADSFLALKKDAIRDPANVSNNMMLFGEYVRANTFVADSVAPNLIECELDMDYPARLVLIFDETVDTSSFIPEKYLIVSPLDGDLNITLNSARSEYAQDRPILTISLGDDDSNRIKYMSGLAESNKTSAVLALPMSIGDMAHKTNYILDKSFVTCEKFNEDTTPPSLIDFSVDINSRSLIFKYDESIRADTFNPTTLRLQNSAKGSVSVYRLTGGIVKQIDSTHLQVVMTEIDMNEIKYKPLLFSNAENTHLSTLSALGPTVLDMNGNPAKNIDVGIKARNFQNDTLGPELEHFDLDVNNGKIRLHFSETIDWSSLDISKIKVQSSFDASKSVTISTDNLEIQNLTDITLQLTLPNQNDLKSEKIGASHSTTWLVMDKGAAKDTLGHGSIPKINGISTMLVRNFYTDISPPKLESFRLDLNSKKLALRFSET
eukprot:UC4_evm1s1203